MTKLRNKPIGFAVRSCLAASAAALAAGLPGTALGETARSGTTSDDGYALQEVVVTGTHLHTADAASANPVAVISAEMLELSNTLTADDILAKLPGIKNNAQFGTGTQTGTSSVNLRYLGNNRNLVLMNGRRYTPTISIAGVAVNVLTIPESMIERIEVLQDGASPIYGSDAIAGVVNIITKRTFDGLQLDAQGGATGHGDGAERHFDVTGGRNFAGDDGNVLLNLDYTRRDHIQVGARKSAQNVVVGYQPNPDGTFTPLYGDAFAPGGATQLPNGTPVAFNSPTSYTVLGPNLYQHDENDQDLLPTLETYSANAQAHFRLGSSIETFAEASYAHTSNMSRGGGAQYLPGKSLLFPSAGIVPANNPYNSFGVAIPLYREYDEVGDRTLGTTGNTTRLVLGLRGDLPHDFKWETFYAYGWSNSNTLFTNLLNVAHLQNSFDPVLCAAAPGCVVANPFGPGSISPEAAAYIRGNDVITNHYTQQIVSGSLTGDLLDLPAGKLSLATGVEVRRETGKTDYDPLATSGQSSTFYAQATRGAFTADEVYGELNVPVLKDLPLVDSLSIDLASRYSHYNTFGDGTTWKAGLNWSITPDVRIRGNIGTAFRAPAIDEFAGGQLTTFSSYSDPCDSVRGQLSNPAVASACAAAGLSPAFLQLTARTNGVQQGNPNLKPETAHDSGVGVVLTPRFAPNLAVSVDYYRISIDKAIFQPPPQLILNDCYQGAPSNSYCQLIQRGVGGQISAIFLEKQNIGAIKTDGLDLSASYQFALADINERLAGTVTLTSTGNYVFTFDQQTTPGAPASHLAGTYSPGLTSTVSRFRSNTSLAYGVGGWRAAYTLRTISGSTVIPASKVAPPSDFHVPSVYYSDVALDYKFSRYGLTFGVQNLTDRQPPFIFNGQNTDLTAYDLVGRVFFGRISAKF